MQALPPQLERRDTIPPESTLRTKKEMIQALFFWLSIRHKKMVASCSTESAIETTPITETMPFVVTATAPEASTEATGLFDAADFFFSLGGAGAGAGGSALGAKMPSG